MSVAGVYFVLAVTGQVKIGVSVDVESRLEALRTGSPVHLECLGVIPGATREVELALHERFARLRLHGEWFSRDSEMDSFIDQATVDLAHAPHAVVTSRIGARLKRLESRVLDLERVRDEQSAEISRGRDLASSLEYELLVVRQKLDRLKAGVLARQPPFPGRLDPKYNEIEYFANEVLREMLRGRR